jgi:hypothetical protein
MIGGTAPTANVLQQTEVDKTLTAAMLALTGTTTIQLAWKAVFPNLTATQKVGIKVCCYVDYPKNNTKRETINAVIKQLLAFDLGGGQHLPTSNIIVFDLGVGYMTNSNVVDISVLPSAQYQGSTTNVDNANGTVMCGGNAFVFSQIITQTVDYLINMPRLSTHAFGQITGALKSHIGSGGPPGSVHGNTLSDYVPLINTQSFLKNKTKLIVYDCIYGRYDGGHNNDPQTWNTFSDNHSPSSIMVGQDPVAMDSVAISLMNAERVNRSMGVYAPGHVQVAGQLGVGVYELAPFSQISYSVVSGATSINPQAPRYYHIPVVNAYPNPVRRGADFNIFTSVEPGTRVEVMIFAAQGALVRQLAAPSLEQGNHNFIWDGMDARGKMVPAGTYIVALQKSGQRIAEKMIAVK